jgi:hypothetical protein
MQISTTRHSSRGSALGTESRVSSCTGSGVPNVATSTGDPSNSGSRHVPGKTTAAIPAWATPASRPSAIGAASISSVPDQPKSANPATAQPAKATVPHNAAKVENRRGVIMPPLAPPEPSTRTAKRATMWIVESRCGRARTKAAGRDDFLNVLPVRNARACLQPAHATQTASRLTPRRVLERHDATSLSPVGPIGPYAACQRALPTCADGASRPRLCGEYPPPECRLSPAIARCRFWLVLLAQRVGRETNHLGKLQELSGQGTCLAPDHADGARGLRIFEAGHRH